MPAIPGFLGPTYQARHHGTVEECINLYPEASEGAQSGKSSGALLGTPGLRLFATVSGVVGACRGMFAASNGRVFGVFGAQFVEIRANGTTLARGDLNDTGLPVTMAENGIHAFLANGTQAKIFTFATNMLSPVFDSDFAGATHVAFIDGYFLLGGAEGQRVRVTQLYDGTDLDALDFGVAEGSPDPVRALLPSHREAILFGDLSTEVFFNTASGGAGFPFERIGGAFIEHGILAPYSPAVLDNTVFWLGQDSQGQGQVWRMQGYNPVRVSTHGIEYALARMPQLTDAIGWAYQQEGHSFYVLTFPAGDATYVYDVATNMWHRRAALGDDGVQHRWPACGHVMAFGGVHLMGTHEPTGKIYALETGYYLHDTQEIVRDRIVGPMVGDNLVRKYYDELWIDMDVGYGLDGATTPGSNPQVMLRASDDGGRTWSPERWKSVGRSGETMAAVRWQKCGSGRQRAWWVRISDPIHVALYGAYYRGGAGRH